MADELDPEQTEQQDDVLFDVDPDWKKLWHGMPSYEHEDLQPWQSILVHFQRHEDRAKFAALMDSPISAKTKSIWYPRPEIGTAADKVWTSAGEHVNPRYPVYIISKGRWESRLTAKCFEWTKIPYHIVVEPQEYDNYAAVIDPAKIITLPFSNLGQGSIPARNFVWEHSISLGAERHWIFDDNISGFCRFTDNLKVEVDSGVLHRIIEDFADRYENLVMAGFNYDYFAPRKMGAKILPVSLNTRVYSGILLSNKIPHRWRGRYNEDTDLSLRILKDGLCTALFNAFLMYKKPTMTMTGGNSDQLYKDEGRRLMAESLKEQHPDVTTVEWKWGRWQHQVDYRPFRKNVLIPREGAVIPEKNDDYGMVLGPMPPDVGHEQQEKQAEVRVARSRTLKPEVQVKAAPVGIMDFLSRDTGLSAEYKKVGESMGLSENLIVTPKQLEELPPVKPDPGPQMTLAETFAMELAKRGHVLLTRDGKFFISNAKQLSDADRKQISELRDELVKMARPWMEEKPEPEPPPPLVLDERPAAASATPAGSLAQLLGSEPYRPPVNLKDWKPDEIPTLDGITDVVVNFATNGTNWRIGDRPVGLTVSTLDGKLTRFLPFAFAGGNLDEEQVKRFARTELKGKKIHGANTRFDMHVSREWGVDLDELGCRFTDIQHTAALLDDHRKRFKIDLLCEDYLPGLPIVPRLDENRHAEYHAGEAHAREHFTAQLVGRLHETMYEELNLQDLGPVQALEDRVIPAVVEMEKNGAPLNEQLLEQNYQECVSRHDKLIMEISAEAGFAFDHTPTTWKRLFEKLGLEPQESYAEGVMKTIDHPLVKKGFFASQLASLNSKTFKAYRENIRSGVLYYEINQLRGEDGGTVTGRFSINYIQQVPNLGNHQAVFGNELFPRYLFIPGPNALSYIASDADQIQYRIFAHHANNARIMKMYADDPKANYHRMIEALLKPYNPNLIYVHVKNMNFMKIFGGGLAKLAMMMGLITEAEFDEITNSDKPNWEKWDDPQLAKAKEVQQIYDREMPEVGPLLQRAIHLAMTKCNKSCNKNDVSRKLHADGLPHRGFVKTVLGRRSRFPDDYRLHKAFCMVDQGSEADVVKTKIADLHEARKDTGFLMRMTSHDELTGDRLAEDTQAKVDAILNHQSFPQLKVPILWESGIGATWADCKK